MKAWRIESHGGPEALKRVDLPLPEAGPLEAVVQVEAVGLNHLDLWVRKGVEGHRFPLPLTPGCDIVGKIVRLGPGAARALASDQIEVGTSVIINPGISCGRCEACLGGFDPLCRSYGILGETQDGGCADEVVVPVANILARPHNLSPVQAASLAIPFLTAWTMLTRKAQLRPGETVLIQAGGSGVSVAAIQIAKLLGATVITTVGSEEKAEKARLLGADFVILYKKVSFREEVRKFLASHNNVKGSAPGNTQGNTQKSTQSNRGCDVVLDHVGTDTFQESLKCLNWGGRFVTCGATSGSNVSLDLKAVFFKNIALLGSTMGSKADLIRILNLVTSGKLKPVIDCVFPMSDLPKAFERLEKREAFGKIVLTAG